MDKKDQRLYIFAVCVGIRGLQRDDKLEKFRGGGKKFAYCPSVS